MAIIPAPIRQYAGTNPSKQKQRQMVDTQTGFKETGAQTPKTRSGTIPAVSILSKKELFYTLRPDCTEYRSVVLREFFTPDRMARCHIDPEQYDKIRNFTFDQSLAIRRELRQINETGLD